MFSEKNISYSILVLPALMVVFFAPSQLYPFAGVKSYFFIGALSLVCMVFGLKKYFLNKNSVIGVDRIDILFLAVVIGMVVTSIFGIDQSLSFFSTLDRGVGVILWIIVFLYTLLLKRVIKKYSNAVHVVDWSLVIAGFIVSLCVWGSSYGFIPQMFSGGLQGNSSLAGAVLLLTLPSFFILFKKIKNTGHNGILLLLIVMCCSVIFNPLFISGAGIGESRGVVLSVLISLCFTGGFYFLISSRKNISAVGKGILIVFAGLVLFCTSLVFREGSNVQNFFKNHSGENRLLFWDTAFQSVNERPILGYGNETFEYSFFKHFDPALYRGNEGWVDKPHNAYIEVIHDNGIIVFSIYILLISYVYYLLITSAKNNEKRYESVVYFFVLTAYLLQNTLVFDSPVSIVLFGLLLARVSYREKSEYEITFSRMYMIGVVLVSCGTFVFCSMRPFLEGNRMYSLARIPVQNVGEFANYVFQTSETGGVVSSAYFANQIMNSIEKESHYGNYDYSESLDGLARAVLNERNSEKSFSAQLFVSRAYTYIYEKNGDREFLNKAKESSLQTIKLSPLNPEGYWAFAYAYALDGNSNESLLAARTVIEIDPDLREAYEKLIFLARKLGNSNVENGTILDAQKRFPDFDKTL